jgi:hypothetical protein
MTEGTMGAVTPDERAELEALRAQRDADVAARNAESDSRGSAVTLSPEDAAELAEMRAERQAARKAAQEAAEEEERNRPKPTHYLHLANGEIIESAGVMTHYGPNSIPVINVAEIEHREEG